MAPWERRPDVTRERAVHADHSTAVGAQPGEGTSSVWATLASGYQIVYQALIVLLVVLYAFLTSLEKAGGEHR
jgi:hypothetical protein